MDGKRKLECKLGGSIYWYSARLAPAWAGWLLRAFNRNCLHPRQGGLCFGHARTDAATQGRPDQAFVPRHGRLRTKENGQTANYAGSMLVYTVEMDGSRLNSIANQFVMVIVSRQTVHAGAPSKTLETHEAGRPSPSQPPAHFSPCHATPLHPNHAIFIGHYGRLSHPNQGQANRRCRPASICTTPPSRFSPLRLVQRLCLHPNATLFFALPRMGGMIEVGRL